MKKFFKKTEGFTLVELIVVIAILGILAGVGTVGYSGYIKKAQKAADNQIVSAINTAFAAACAENGVNHTAFTSGVKATPADAKAVTGIDVPDTHAKASDIEEDFAKYYKGNEGNEFKTIDSVSALNFKNGMFSLDEIVETSYRGVTLKLSQKDIDTLTDSALGNLGARTLLTEAGSAIEWADEFGLAGMGGSSYWNSVLSYFGLTDSDFASMGMEGVTGFADIPDEQREQAVAMTLAIKKNMDEESVAEMMSNATAIYVARNTSNVTTDSVSQWLTGESTTDSLQGSPKATTLAEAAAIYGLYMAYEGEDFNKDENGATLTVLDVMANALSDKEGFGAWVSGEEGKAELEAYKAAMSIANDATVDEAGLSAVLTNGLDDEQLIAVMENLMKN